MNHKPFCDILNSEMGLATGCTEPAAVALCAAHAAAHLNGSVAELTVEASINVIKNAMAAGIPGISQTGIHYAAALGALGGQTGRQLQVIDAVSEEKCLQAVALVQGGHVKVLRKDTAIKLYIEVEVRSTSGHQARAVIATGHTNLVLVEQDGQTILQHNVDTKASGIPADVMEATLSIRSIFDFVNELDPVKDDLHMIEQAIQINDRISREGAEHPFNLRVGQNILSMRQRGLLGSDMVSQAAEHTACGIDARMGGAGLPVVTNSGSGNQGITATIPIITAARYLGIDQDRMFRAVTLSHLMTIYIHCHFGLLSAFCGATVAGTAVSCGLVYLLGGTAEQIGRAVNNMLGTVSGMMCDGAKADCALKVVACVNTAFLCAHMALSDVSVQPNEGIVEADPTQTINNFVRLANDTSPTMDNTILDIMLSKTHCGLTALGS